MTHAQRLRLVVALGVVNLVLATVALGFGMSGLSTPPVTADGPPSGADVGSVPTLPAPSRAAPGAASSLELPRPTPSPVVPGPSTDPGPAPSPSTEPTPVPTPVPTLEPTPVPTGPSTTVAPTRLPVVIAGHSAESTPVPSKETAGDPSKGDPPHAGKPPKYHPRKHHHHKHHRKHRHERHHHEQAIDVPRPGSKIGGRLRVGRRGR